MTDESPKEPLVPTDKPTPPSTTPDDFEFPSLHTEEEPAKVTIPSEEKPPAPLAQETPASPALSVAPKKMGTVLKEWAGAHKGASLLIGFVAVAGLMWGVSAWRGRATESNAADAQGTPDEIPVNAVEVRFGRFQDEIKTTGNLKGEAEIELRFEVDGKIVELNFKEGQKVSKGQIIARLSDRDAQLKLKRAKNELEQTTRLFELGGVSKTKLDEASLNLDIAQTELEKTRIVATRDGIIGDKAVDVGEFVNPQRKIATLVAIRNVIVSAGVIEKQVDKIFPGQKVLTTVDAYPGSVFEGVIETISPIGFGDSKTFSITVIIPNKDSLLLPSMFARVRIITYEIDDALTVPSDALDKKPGGYQLWIVNKDNIANPVDVEIGYVATEFTQIKAGIAAGDIVIVLKPPELKAGSKVKIIEMTKPQN